MLQPNAFKLTYIPKWSKYFDSFITPELNVKEFELRSGSLVSGQTWAKIIWDIIKPEVFPASDEEDDTIVYELPEPDPALLKFINEEEEL